MTDVVKSTKKKPEIDHQSMDLALSEIRYRFEREDARGNTLETKAERILAVDGLFIGLIAIFWSDFLRKGESVSLDCSSISLLFGSIILGLSIIFSLIVMLVGKYKWPGEETEDFFSYATITYSKAKDKFLREYMESHQHNKKINDRKASSLLGSQITLFAALFFIFLTWKTMYLP